MKKKFFFDRKEKKLQMDSEENSFERCVLFGVVTDVPVQMPVSERKCYIPGAGQLCRDCCRELYGSDDLGTTAESEICKIQKDFCKGEAYV